MKSCRVRQDRVNTGRARGCRSGEEKADVYKMIYFSAFGIIYPCVNYAFPLLLLPAITSVLKCNQSVSDWFNLLHSEHAWFFIVFILA